LLLPGKLPNLSRENDSPQKGFRVYLGKNVCELTRARDIIVLKRKEWDLISLRVSPEGAYITATILREDGRIVTKIINNEYSINPNNYFESPIRTDKSTISVRDRNGTLALKASYLNENSFEVLGTFVVPGLPPLLVTRDKIEIGGTKYVGSIAVDPGQTCFNFG
jgi:hypothetical protein